MSWTAPGRQWQSGLVSGLEGALRIVVSSGRLREARKSIESQITHEQEKLEEIRAESERHES